MDLSLGEIIFWGLIGGLVAEFSEIYINSRTPDGFPAHMKTARYIITALIMIGLGALFNYAYFRMGSKLNVWLSMNIGASAPLLIGQLRQALPKPVTD